MTYTRDQLEAMTDRELDAVEAEVVFGEPMPPLPGDDESDLAAVRALDGKAYRSKRGCWYLCFVGDVPEWHPERFTTWSGMGLVVEKMTAMRITDHREECGCESEPFWAMEHTPNDKPSWTAGFKHSYQYEGDSFIYGLCASGHSLPRAVCIAAVLAVQEQEKP